MIFNGDKNLAFSGLSKTGDGMPPAATRQTL
jgi:hypothetical protein